MVLDFEGCDSLKNSKDEVEHQNAFRKDAPERSPNTVRETSRRSPLFAPCIRRGGCHDLAYGKLFPTEGRDLRGLSQLGHLDHVLVRKPTGQFPLSVDGTSRDTGLPSRTTRRGLSTE